MNPKEFSQTYCLHDSLIVAYEFDASSNELSFDIELSNYMQDNYKEGDTDIIPCRIKFASVSSYSVPDEFESSDVVLELSVEGASLILLMENSETGDCYKISVEAASVSIIKNEN